MDKFNLITQQQNWKLEDYLDEFLKYDFDNMSKTNKEYVMSYHHSLLTRPNVLIYNDQMNKITLELLCKVLRFIEIFKVRNIDTLAKLIFESLTTNDGTRLTGTYYNFSNTIYKEILINAINKTEISLYTSIIAKILYVDSIFVRLNRWTTYDGTRLFFSHPIKHKTCKTNPEELKLIDNYAKRNCSRYYSKIRDGNYFNSLIESKCIDYNEYNKDLHRSIYECNNPEVIIDVLYDIINDTYDKSNSGKGYINIGRYKYEKHNEIHMKKINLLSFIVPIIVKFDEYSKDTRIISMLTITKKYVHIDEIVNFYKTYYSSRYSSYYNNKNLYSSKSLILQYIDKVKYNLSFSDRYKILSDGKINNNRILETRNSLLLYSEIKDTLEFKTLVLNNTYFNTKGNSVISHIYVLSENFYDFISQFKVTKSGFIEYHKIRKRYEKIFNHEVEKYSEEIGLYYLKLSGINTKTNVKFFIKNFVLTNKLLIKFFGGKFKQGLFTDNNIAIMKKLLKKIK